MFNGVSIQDFLTGTVLVIILIIGAIVAATKYRNGGVREAAGIVAVTLIAMLIVGMATHVKEVSNWVYGLFFK